MGGRRECLDDFSKYIQLFSKLMSHCRMGRLGI